MAKTYRLGFSGRVANRIVQGLLHVGLGPRHTYLLRVLGRKTGRLYTTPVTLVEESGQRWLVAPYGEVGWVRNARAAGQVTLSRGGRTETLSLVEVGPLEAAPILKRYVTQVPITRPFFDVSYESDLAAFIAEAASHPVFRLADPARR